MQQTKNIQNMPLLRIQFFPMRPTGVSHLFLIITADKLSNVELVRIGFILPYDKDHILIIYFKHQQNESPV
jgi:hypothetical protein